MTYQCPHCGHQIEVPAARAKRLEKTTGVWCDGPGYGQRHQPIVRMKPAND